MKPKIEKGDTIWNVIIDKQIRRWKEIYLVEIHNVKEVEDRGKDLVITASYSLWLGEYKIEDAEYKSDLTDPNKRSRGEFFLHQGHNEVIYTDYQDARAAFFKKVNNDKYFRIPDIFNAKEKLHLNWLEPPDRR